MTKALTVREVLDIENFDPLNIDVTEFDALAKSMPQDANLDIPIAETLAAQFLRAADRCSEILSTLIWLEGRLKARKNAIRNRMYLAAKEEGYKTVEERKAYAESHGDFVDADEAYATAYAVRKNFEMRHDYFLKSHQYMKERLRGEVKHQEMSGFSRNSNEKLYGERNW